MNRTWLDDTHLYLLGEKSDEEFVKFLFTLRLLVSRSRCPHHNRDRTLQPPSEFHRYGRWYCPACRNTAHTATVAIRDGSLFSTWPRAPLQTVFVGLHAVYQGWSYEKCANLLAEYFHEELSPGMFDSFNDHYFTQWNVRFSYHHVSFISNFSCTMLFSWIF